MKTWLRSLKKTMIRRVFLAYFVFMFAWLVVPPMFEVINRVEPWVLGMPFVVFMIAAISFLVCLGLVLLFEIERVRGDLR
ncbi:MAG: DUF3311 domain-containing protein [Thermoleophilia bacterium]